MRRFCSERIALFKTFTGPNKSYGCVRLFSRMLFVPHGCSNWINLINTLWRSKKILFVVSSWRSRVRSTSARSWYKHFSNSSRITIGHYFPQPWCKFKGGSYEFMIHRRRILSSFFFLVWKLFMDGYTRIVVYCFFPSGRINEGSS